MHGPLRPPAAQVPPASPRDRPRHGPESRAGRHDRSLRRHRRIQNLVLEAGLRGSRDRAHPVPAAIRPRDAVEGRQPRPDARAPHRPRAPTDAASSSWRGPFRDTRPEVDTCAVIRPWAPAAAGRSPLRHQDFSSSGARPVDLSEVALVRLLSVPRHRALAARCRRAWVSPVRTLAAARRRDHRGRCCRCPRGARRSATRPGRRAVWSSQGLVLGRWGRGREAEPGSLASRRVASLRPRFAGLTALTPGCAHGPGRACPTARERSDREGPESDLLTETWDWQRIELAPPFNSDLKFGPPCTLSA